MGKVMDIERRFFKSELRAEDSKPVAGYGSVFNAQSEDLGGFREIIAPGAFDGRLDDDVRALFNHDPNLILGRTKSGTLKLSVDDEGLRYDVDFPNTTLANDLRTSIQRGDVDQSSFAFTVDEDDFEERDGVIIRTIHKVKRLFDVSPVTYPAYPDASVGVRSLENFLNKRGASSEIKELHKEQLEKLRNPNW